MAVSNKLREAKNKIHDKIKEIRPQAKELAQKGHPEIWKYLEHDYYALVKAIKNGAENIEDLNIDFKSDIVVKIIQELVENESDLHSANLQTENITDRRSPVVKSTTTTVDVEINILNDKSMKKTGFEEKYEISVTENNLAEIFRAGKKDLMAGLDLSVLQKYKEAEFLLFKHNEKAILFKASRLGDTAQIQQMKNQLASGVKELAKLQQKLSVAKREWVKNAHPLFMDACRANTRILFGPKGFNITEGSWQRDNGAPGVYTTSKPVSGSIKITHLPTQLAEEFQSKAKSLSDKWSNYLAVNTEVWKKVAEITGSDNITPQMTIDEAIEKSQNHVNSEYSKAQKHETWSQELKAMEANIEKLRVQKDAVMERILEIDLLLTAFSLPSDLHIYNQNWIERVKKVASERRSMPYLPLYWDEKSLGSVFDWQKAIEDGKPNLFIEAATEEGLEGRMDMLDNFIATMLLAFPVKDVHITILEKSPINSFVNELPEKICQVYDAGTDSEAIRLFTRQLKEMYRAGRDNSSPDCCPREIVVISGFRTKDRVFTDLMDNLSEIIENGKRAGIYFAIVLYKDITEYDWSDSDTNANNFEQHFLPYSTVLTNKKDKYGNPIPDYRLLKRDADIMSEDGKEKAGALGELIHSYLIAQSTVIKSKVYEPVKSGELYASKPIKSLADQTKSDLDQLVIPIAETEDEKPIYLRLDDKTHIFTMILGASGSGKSFMLHNILTNLMLKYDPSAVEVVLMDFKGVEFNYYKDVPHVSTVLVNGADYQMVNEILSSIMREMDDRQKKFEKAGVQNISGYNKFATGHNLAPMKHYVVLVDECQDLFNMPSKGNDVDVVTAIARKGRSFGVHMVLATQTLQGVQIKPEALKQFTDFLFMRSSPDDVIKCGIDNREIQNAVSKMTTGEVIYCHTTDQPVTGYSYNYSGSGEEFRKKTHENLLSKRFSKPNKPQFYFNASQEFTLDDSELNNLSKISKAGLHPVPIAALGKNLSVDGDTVYTRFSSADGANLLILGANEQLQGERVLWNAVISLYETNNKIGAKSRYLILPNIPEFVDPNAVRMHEDRMELLHRLGDKPGVTIVDEEDRYNIIEQVAATVRVRQQLFETDRAAVKKLDDIYLIIPNQQLLSNRMSRRPKGLSPLDDGIVVGTESDVKPIASQPQQSDALGFEGLVMPGAEEEHESAGFMDIDFGSFDSPVSSSVTPAPAAGKPGRDYDEELRYILEYGSVVKVHVLLQTISPDKIFAENTMRAKEMVNSFNDIVILRMLQADSMSLPVDSREVEKLNGDVKSLRALVYNSERGVRTVIPFTIPII